MGGRQSKSRTTHHRTYASKKHWEPLKRDNEHRVFVDEFINWEKHKNINKNYSSSSKSQTTHLKLNRYDQTEIKPEKVEIGIRKSRSVDDCLLSRSENNPESLSQNVSRPGKGAPISSTGRTSIDKSSSSLTINKRKEVKTTSQPIPNHFGLSLIQPEDIQNAREIGKGNFGTVYQALYKGRVNVALKTLHSNDRNVSDSGIKDYDGHIDELINEANTMGKLKHENLLRFHGITFYGANRKLSLVTDFMVNGSLLNYLRTFRDEFCQCDSRKRKSRLNYFARQIYSAMFYLEERAIIHRDLAARNCLIGENDLLKVGDFGLTRLTDCGVYKGTYRSVCAPRWTSPEAMFQSKYSSRSDVWSYGITLWEIYSLGQRPFADLTNSSVRNILRNPTQTLAHHLPKPNYCSSEQIYTHLILVCLTFNETIRPRFTDLRERIVTILHHRNHPN